MFPLDYSAIIDKHQRKQLLSIISPTSEPYSVKISPQEHHKDESTSTSADSNGDVEIEAEYIKPNNIQKGIVKLYILYYGMV